MDAKWIIAQIIGLLGTGCMLASFQSKENKGYFLLQFSYNVLYIVHYILLGALSGSLTVILSLIRNGLLLMSDRKWARWNGWVVLLVLASIYAVVISWDNIFSIFPAIAMISMTIANWTMNGKTIRLCNLFVGSPAWLIYNIRYFSISGIIAETLSIISIIISIKRFGLDNLDNKE